MSLARNLSKFKPSSSGLVETADIADDAINADKIADNAVTTDRIADDAVTTAKVNPAQTDITSVGTLSGLTTAGATISASNPNLNLSATADGGEGAVQFKDDQGNVDGKIAYRTDYAGNTDNYMTIQTSGTEKFRIDTDGNTKIRNANATGPILDIGTTSTSVADDGVIGGLDFTAGSSSTVNGRLHCKQYDTGENAGYFSNELRAPNGNSLGEVSREFITQNAHGGVYVKRPMPANVFYYREFFKSINVSASVGSSAFITLNQNDYYFSVSAFIDVHVLDTSYPTGAFLRRYGLTGHTHQGLSSLNSRLTQIIDMGEHNTGSSEVGSASANFILSKSTSKSAGSNNGHLYINYSTGSYTAASVTMKLYGMFLNCRVDAQDITANL